MSGEVPVIVSITAQVAAVHACGARGLLCFDANIAPGLTAEVWRALDAADDPALARALPRLLRCNLALSKPGNPRSLKAALEILGRDGGALRAPYLPLTPDERAELERDLLALDLTARA
jgi:4-hydroxy-tetrahydrodipicolinate synthase